MSDSKSSNHGVFHLGQASDTSYHGFLLSEGVVETLIFALTGLRDLGVQQSAPLRNDPLQVEYYAISRDAINTLEGVIAQFREATEVRADSTLTNERP